MAIPPTLKQRFVFTYGACIYKYQYVLGEQTATLATVLSILMQANQGSMATIIKNLEQQEQDALMKYLYKGMEDPVEGPSGNAQCAALLGWHQKVGLWFSLAIY